MGEASSPQATAVRNSSSVEAKPPPSAQPLAPVVVDLSPYLTLRLLLGALVSGPRVNFANAHIVE